MLREAILAWEPLLDDAALVIVRSVVGGLVMDEEIADSLNRAPSLGQVLDEH